MAAAGLDEFCYESSLKNVIDQNSLKWIFVGGKGGVGKTTVSCSLAVQLSRVRESVLIISTDPAHNVSDAFGQKFATRPRLVEGFNNLYAMELDPTADTSALPDESNPPDSLLTTMEEFFPGCHEFNGFKMLLNLAERMDYSVIVFDTAPTGHTLRMLASPLMFAKSFGRLSEIVDNLAPVASHVADLVGKPYLRDFVNMYRSGSRQFPDDCKDAVKMLKDADKTTFVCVCMAEFLPLYETERLIHQLSKYGIDTHNIVVNQLNTPRPGDTPCRLCTARQKLQDKYLEQIEDLYQEDFHITRLPLMAEEVRKAEGLSAFSDYLLQPHE
ncbi:hypothetical protein ACOMHN_055964 [Nucella lapillus]